MEDNQKPVRDLGIGGDAPEELSRKTDGRLPSMGDGGRAVSVLHRRAGMDIDSPRIRRWLWYGATPLKTH